MTYQTQYSPPYKGLGVPRSKTSNLIEWETCRDRFANVFTKKTKVIYYCPASTNINDDSDYVNSTAFIKLIENELELKERTKIEIVMVEWGKTPSASSMPILKLHVPQFWSCDSNRRSLFSLLVKISRHYKPETKSRKTTYDQRDAIISTLQKDPGTVRTLKAILRFLDGHTIVFGECQSYRGWVYRFSNISSLKLKLTLFKPNKVFAFLKKYAFLFGWGIVTISIMDVLLMFYAIYKLIEVDAFSKM